MARGRTFAVHEVEIEEARASRARAQSEAAARRAPGHEPVRLSNSAARAQPRLAGGLARTLRRVSNQLVQRLAAEDSFPVPEGIERTLTAEQGRGQPLAQPVRRQMEGALGADLGGVRVHADGQAGRVAGDLAAHAFTAGSDIYFAPGQYEPQTEDGQRVLGHELAHVLQGQPGAKAIVGAVDDPAEIEADAVADEVVRTIRRQESPEDEDEQTLRRQSEGSEDEEEQQIRRTPATRSAGVGDLVGYHTLAEHARRVVPVRAIPTVVRREAGASSQGTIQHNAGGTGYYDVTGATLEEISPQLDPDEWGHCRVHYQVSYQSTEGNITQVNITTSDHYRMPRWRGPTRQAASAAARAEWDRMVAALWVHEHGHRDIGRREAATIQSGLLGEPEANYETRKNQLVQDAQGLQDTYDVDTDHGQTQGVSLDLTIE
ncbi:MAG: DUF4157 domain-containing protein [Chloroflexota bacterium]